MTRSRPSCDQTEYMMQATEDGICEVLRPIAARRRDLGLEASAPSEERPDRRPHRLRHAVNGRDDAPGEAVTFAATPSMSGTARSALDRVAVQAVCSVPVSAEFPVKQGKNREFSQNHPLIRPVWPSNRLVSLVFSV